MYALAPLRCGLVVSENMTKTRTDVLVVAQRGAQSGKAKKAAQWGKPVLAAEDFLTWAAATGAPGVAPTGALAWGREVMDHPQAG